MNRMNRRAFTLTEVIVVLGIMMLLSALLFPAIGTAKSNARRSTCLSNLRQLGMSITMYTQDYDGLFPRGGDPTDINTTTWNTAFRGEFAADAKALQPLPIIMQPYVKRKELWQCPADIGFDRADTAGSPLLDARPTSFGAFGTSYYYRTELTLRRRITLTSYEPEPPFVERGSSEINVLFDGSGIWHGGSNAVSKRYNVLMGDGHVTNINAPTFQEAWSLLTELPQFG